MFLVSLSSDMYLGYKVLPLGTTTARPTMLQHDDYTSRVTPHHNVSRYSRIILVYITSMTDYGVPRQAATPCQPCARSPAHPVGKVRTNGHFCEQQQLAAAGRQDTTAGIGTNDTFTTYYVTRVYIMCSRRPAVRLLCWHGSSQHDILHVIMMSRSQVLLCTPLSTTWY